MLLCLKAGGVGLNLTAATHVFHFDRWWNPAVEDQATDRTYRIGQTHNVQVHKFITMGTLEEKIDGMLESKRDLADRVVGTGEGWLTELDDDALRRLVLLEPDADIMGDEEANGNGNGHGIRGRPSGAAAAPAAGDGSEDRGRGGGRGHPAPAKAHTAAVEAARRKPSPPEGGALVSQMSERFGTTWWGRLWITRPGAAGRRLREPPAPRQEVRGGGRRQPLHREPRRDPGQGPRPQDLQRHPGPAGPLGVQWEKALERIHAESRFVASLLAGEMPQGLDETFREAGASLYPRVPKELQTHCDCPDWANPCKHVAAVCYIMAEALDRDPWLLFDLRGRTREEVLEALQAAHGGARRRARARASAAGRKKVVSVVDLLPRRHEMAEPWLRMPEEAYDAPPVPIPEIALPRAIPADPSVFIQLGPLPHARIEASLCLAALMHRTAQVVQIQIEEGVGNMEEPEPRPGDPGARRLALRIPHPRPVQLQALAPQQEAPLGQGLTTPGAAHEDHHHPQRPRRHRPLLPGQGHRQPPLHRRPDPPGPRHHGDGHRPHRGPDRAGHRATSSAILAEAGTDWHRVVKTTVFLTDLARLRGLQRRLRAACWAAPSPPAAPSRWRPCPGAPRSRSSWWRRSAADAMTSASTTASWTSSATPPWSA